MDPVPTEGTRLLRLAFVASKQTRKAFGEAHGVTTPSYMSRLLSGERSPGRQLAAQWADELAIPLDAWDRSPADAMPSLDPDESGDHPAVAPDATGTDPHTG